MRRLAITASLLAAMILAGCAFGSYGRGGLYRTQPAFAPGTPKAQIVEALGPPDKYVKIDQTEYLTYKTHQGFFVVFLGRTEATDYEITLIDEKFDSARWLPTGRSIGIFYPQGAVAE